MNFTIEGLQSLPVEEIVNSLDNFEPGDLLAYGMTMGELAPSVLCTEAEVMEGSYVISLAQGCLALNQKYGLYMDNRYVFSNELDAMDPDLENHGDYYIFMTMQTDDN